MAIRRKKDPLFTTAVRLKILLIVLILCLALLLLNKNGAISLWKEKQIHRELIKEETRLKEENTILKEEKTKLENDRQYIEKIAREQYNMLSPGETLYKVIKE